MILVDTATWIDHFDTADARLAAALARGDIGTHPFVIGEVGLGRWPRRAASLALLRRLPHLPVATDVEVWHLVERHGLAGSGIGWVDAHLLTAAIIAGWVLWTPDRALARVATRLARLP